MLCGQKLNGLLEMNLPKTKEELVYWKLEKGNRRIFALGDYDSMAAMVDALEEYINFFFEYNIDLIDIRYSKEFASYEVLFCGHVVYKYSDFVPFSTQGPLIKRMHRLTKKVACYKNLEHIYKL